MARKRKKKKKKRTEQVEPIVVNLGDSERASRLVLDGQEAQMVRAAAKKSGMPLEEFLKHESSASVVNSAALQHIKAAIDPSTVHRLSPSDRENLYRVLQMWGSKDEDEHDFAKRIIRSTVDLDDPDRFVLMGKALEIWDQGEAARADLKRIQGEMGSDRDGVLFVLKKREEVEKRLGSLLGELAEAEAEVRRRVRKYEVLPAIGLEVGSFLNASPLRLEGRSSVLSDTAVENYLDFLAWCLHYSRMGGEGAESYTHLWSVLRSSAIFAIPSQLYLQFYTQVEHWLSQTFGRRWKPKSEGQANGRDIYNIDGGTEILRWAAQKAQSQSIPEKLPFDRFFMGYEPPLALNFVQHTVLRLDEEEEMGRKIDSAFLLGHIVTPLRVVSVLLCRAGHEASFVPFHELTEAGWIGGSSCTGVPWVVPALIDWINEHRTVIEDSKTFSYRRKMQKEGKALKVKNLVPPPYYTVYMKDTLIEEVKRYGEVRFRKEIEWNHRWTVRGHWMVRVKRGPLPLGIEDEQKLRQRKYKIFTLDSPDFETWKHLERRGVKPKRVDEWMAVLISWRKDYVKGPEDKPLIPSVRKSAKKRRNHEEINQ